MARRRNLEIICITRCHEPLTGGMTYNLCLVLPTWYVAKYWPAYWKFSTGMLLPQLWLNNAASWFFLHGLGERLGSLRSAHWTHKVCGVELRRLLNNSKHNAENTRQNNKTTASYYFGNIIRIVLYYSRWYEKGDMTT